VEIQRPSFLKYLWFPIIWFGGLLFFACYMAWKEFKVNDHLVEQALQGNRYAIAILAKYPKPWKLDERIVNSALDGNSNALAVLQLPHEMNTEIK
jgi:hypothetical protein